MIVNGQAKTNIAIADRAVQYGDGCFTTIACIQGQLEFFDAHIKRLKHACERLAIPFYDWQKLIDSTLSSIQKMNDNCVVKIIISRGQGGRGYSPQGANQPTFIVSHHVYPKHYQSWRKSGIKLTVSPIKLACQPLLAGIKHLNRLEQVLVKHDLANTEYDDAIVCDTKHDLVETSIGNLFWLIDGNWFTPSLDSSGVEGVMRNEIIKLMKQSGIAISVVTQPIHTLLEAEAAFICNSLMKVVPVCRLFDPSTKQTHYFNISVVLAVQNMLEQLAEPSERTLHD